MSDKEMDSEMGAVTIAVRERPQMESQLGFGDETTISPISVCPLNEKILIVDDRPFVFDHIIGPSIGQSELFDAIIKPLTVQLMKGFYCTVLAYGQTGTGKSYTMGLQAEEFDTPSAGMIPRTLSEVFDKANGMCSGDGVIHTEISVSFIEIYNEKVYDLLAENSLDQINTKGYKCPGGTKCTVQSIVDAKRILQEGNKNRHVRPTKMNQQSSRSHAIFTIHLNIVRITGDSRTTVASAFHLVDLAGSESVRRTGHQGVALTEGVNINQGLLSIGKVCQALSIGSKVIPYRDSVLSTVLQDSLNTNSYLTLLACISPAKEDVSATISTLRFAQNAKTLKHTPQINAIIADYKSKTPVKSYISAPLRAQNTTNAVTPVPRQSLFPTSIQKRKPPLNNTICTPANKKFKSTVNENKNPTTIRDRMSLYNPTFNDLSRMDSRQSIWNVSTSTVIDTGTNHQPSYSPLIRRCAAEFNATLETKIIEIVGKHIQQPSIDQSDVNGTVEPRRRSRRRQSTEEKDNEATKQCNVNNISWSSMKIELKEIIRNEIANATINDKEEHLNDNRLQDDTISEDIFKKPFNKLQSEIQLSEQKDFVESTPCTRRSSTRISMRRNTVTRDDSNPIDISKRKSTRLSIRPVTQIVHVDKPKKLSAKMIKHHSGILKILNTGDLKLLKTLPRIGVKTAYQIVTHRTLKGKFKTIDDVGKLPIWRGKYWQNFLEVNLLV